MVHAWKCNSHKTQIGDRKTHTNFALNFQLTRFGGLDYTGLVRLMFEGIDSVPADRWPNYQQGRGGVVDVFKVVC